MDILIYVFRNWSRLEFFYCNNKEKDWEKYLGNFVPFLHMEEF